MKSWKNSDKLVGLIKMKNNSENWSWKFLQLEPNYKHYLRQKKIKKKKKKKGLNWFFRSFFLQITKVYLASKVAKLVAGSQPDFLVATEGQKVAKLATK